MSATFWLGTVFIIGLLLVVIGIFYSDFLILFGLAFMLPAPTIGLMATIERLK